MPDLPLAYQQSPLPINIAFTVFAASDHILLTQVEAKELTDRNAAAVAALKDISEALAERQAALEETQQAVRSLVSQRVLVVSHMSSRVSATRNKTFEAAACVGLEPAELLLSEGALHLLLVHHLHPSCIQGRCLTSIPAMPQLRLEAAWETPAQTIFSELVPQYHSSLKFRSTAIAGGAAEGD